MERAKRRLVEDRRIEVLRDRVRAWQEADAIRAYRDAVEARLAPRSSAPTLGPPGAGFDVDDGPCSGSRGRSSSARRTSTVPEITIHSSNPVGRQRLRRALDAITRRLEPLTAARLDPAESLGRPLVSYGGESGDAALAPEDEDRHLDGLALGDASEEEAAGEGPQVSGEALGGEDWASERLLPRSRDRRGSRSAKFDVARRG